MLLDQNALPLFRNPGACDHNQHLTSTTCISPSGSPHSLSSGIPRSVHHQALTISVLPVTGLCEVHHYAWVIMAGRTKCVAQCGNGFGYCGTPGASRDRSGLARRHEQKPANVPLRTTK